MLIISRRLMLMPVLLSVSHVLYADTTYTCNLPTFYGRADALRPALPGERITFWTNKISGNVISSTAPDTSVDLSGLWNVINAGLKWTAELRVNVNQNGWIAGQFYTSGNVSGITAGMQHFSTDSASTSSHGWTIIPSAYANAFDIRNDSSYTFTGFTVGQLSYLSYAGSTAPFTVTWTTPANEYADYTVKFTLSVDVSMGVSNASQDFFRSGDWSWGTTQQTMTCTARGTALALTLDGSEVDFGSVDVGSITPVVRELNWRASGSGQANVWTMTIDSLDGKVSGNDFLLGNGRVQIVDKQSGTIMTPGVATGVSGISGTYVLTLDPTGARAGVFENLLNLTLRAD